MTRNAKKYLHDILHALQEIEEAHLENINSQEEYKAAGSTIHRAVERELQIVGEAATRLRKMDVELNGTDQLIDRRNTIVHQYDGFQPRTIWNLIAYQMSVIRQEVEELLEE